MNHDDYQKALDTATAELQELLRQKGEIDRRITKLRQTAANLDSLRFDDLEEDDTVYVPSVAERARRTVGQAVVQLMVGRTIGFTEACREVLRASDDFITPTEIKDGLIMMGIDLETKYSNPLAVIHTTLRRLVTNDEVDVKSKDGKPTFRWKRSIRIGDALYTLKEVEPRQKATEPVKPEVSHYGIERLKQKPTEPVKPEVSRYGIERLKQKPTEPVKPEVSHYGIERPKPNAANTGVRIVKHLPDIVPSPADKKNKEGK